MAVFIVDRCGNQPSLRGYDLNAATSSASNVTSGGGTVPRKLQTDVMNPLTYRSCGSSWACKGQSRAALRQFAGLSSRLWPRLSDVECPALTQKWPVVNPQRRELMG